MNLWTIAIALTGTVAVGAFVSSFISQKRVDALRDRGIYPEEGQEREDDVIRLLSTGEKIMAIKCYRTIHKVGLKEAKAAVESIERKMPSQ